MTKNSDTNGTVRHTGGIGLCGLMFLLFLGLRLTDNIDWAWYWVAAPLWMPAGIALVCFSVAIVYIWYRTDDAK